MSKAFLGFNGRVPQGVEFISLFILAITIWGCANQISPKGGKGDEIPPEVTRTFPKDQELFVDASTIKIYFSEAVKKPTYNKELFISPLLPKPPRIYLSDSGKRIKIQIEEGLEDSTTYVLTLKEVQDHFGGNKLEQVYTFAFSTGPYIDSMEVKGEVQSPVLGVGQEEMILLLFPADSIENNYFLGKRPFYISQTDKAGRFSFSNLRKTPYRLYGLIDVDQSATYSQFTETIALGDSSLISFSDTSNVVQTKLYAFLPDEQEPTFRNYVWLNDSTWMGEFTETFLIDSLSLAFSDTAGNPIAPIETFAALPTEKKELVFQSPISKGDSMFLSIQGLLDSLGNREDTVIKLRASRTREIEAPLVQKPEYDFKESAWKVFAYKALQASDTAFIVLTDTTQARPAIGDTIPALPAIAEDIPYAKALPINLDANGFMTLIRPREKLEPSNAYILHIRGQMIGQEDTVYKFKLTLPDPEEFGTWQGMVRPEGYQGPLVTQLLKDEKMVRQVFDSTFSFRFLEPGAYQIQVIYDRDGNKTWTPGQTNPYRLPERIYRYPTTTTIRANWDIEGDTLKVLYDIPIQEPAPDTAKTASNPRQSGNSSRPIGGRGRFGGRN
ncbi:MAG: Ig-like domain-containing protein [Bacteroidota bacterium]